MIFLKSRHFHRLLRLQTPSNYSHRFSFLSSISRRPISISAHFVQTSNRNSPKTEKPPISAEFAQISKQVSPKIGNPLSLFFKESVWISKKTDCGEIEAETDCKNAELIEKLRNLGEKIDSLDKKRHQKEKIRKPRWIIQVGDTHSGNKQRLSDSFNDRKIVKLEAIDLGNEDPKVHKSLSSDMQLVANHLYTAGYLKNASFMPKNKFDSSRFEASYARDYLKCAAVEFGKDHQEIAKWLSASDLKTIALFGCPSLGEKSVKGAKHMRAFFKIDEQKVCHKCILKDSCKLANKKSRKDSSKLRLGDVTRVLVMYALDSVPQKLVVPEEIKNAVSRLLNEVINLCDTVSTDLSKTPDLQ